MIIKPQMKIYELKIFFLEAILLLCLGRLLNIKPIEVFHLMSYMIRKPQTNIYKGKFVFLSDLILLF